MLSGLIIISFIIWIATLVVRGFSLYMLFTLAAFMMFAVKKIGVYIKFNNIIVCETLPLFITVAFQLLFKNFDITIFVITLVLRCIFIGIVVYDEKQFVYFTEERKVDK